MAAASPSQGRISPAGSKTPESVTGCRSPGDSNSPISEDSCPICLGTITDKCTAESCFHSFCFVCLKEWAKQKAVCPLCKQPFSKILYAIKSESDYKEFIIPRRPPPPNSRRLFESIYNDVSRAVLPNLPYPLPVYRTRRRNDRASSSYRLSLYVDNLWVQPIADITGQYRESSPDLYREQPALTHRLVSWVNREIAALVPSSRVSVVLLMIMDLIERYPINSREFKRAVRPHFGNRTNHFIHEFYNFARSPYDMVGHDLAAQYVPHSELRNVDIDTGSSSEDDDIIEIPIAPVSSTVIPIQEIEIRSNELDPVVISSSSLSSGSDEEREDGLDASRARLRPISANSSINSSTSNTMQPNNSEESSSTITALRSLDASRAITNNSINSGTSNTMQPNNSGENVSTMTELRSLDECRTRLRSLIANNSINSTTSNTTQPNNSGENFDTITELGSLDDSRARLDDIRATLRLHSYCVNDSLNSSSSNTMQTNNSGGLFNDIAELRRLYDRRARLQCLIASDPIFSSTSNFAPFNNSEENSSTITELRSLDEPGPSGITSTGTSSSYSSSAHIKNEEETRHDSDDCFVVNTLKPKRERTPEIINLLSESSDNSQKVESDNKTKVIKKAFKSKKSANVKRKTKPVLDRTSFSLHITKKVNCCHTTTRRTSGERAEISNRRNDHDYCNQSPSSVVIDVSTPSLSSSCNDETYVTVSKRKTTRVKRRRIYSSDSSNGRQHHHSNVKVPPKNSTKSNHKLRRDRENNFRKYFTSSENDDSQFDNINIASTSHGHHKKKSRKHKRYDRLRLSRSRKESEKHSQRTSERTKKKDSSKQASKKRKRQYSTSSTSSSSTSDTDSPLSTNISENSIANSSSSDNLSVNKLLKIPVNKTDASDSEDISNICNTIKKYNKKRFKTLKTSSDTASNNDERPSTSHSVHLTSPEKLHSSKSLSKTHKKKKKRSCKKGKVTVK